MQALDRATALSVSVSSPCRIFFVASPSLTRISPYAILLTNMTFSIVIPSKNEEKFIGILLKSIKEQTIQPQKIVVADKSSDKTRDVARTFGAIIVEGMDDGRIGKARNLGAAKTNSDYILFLDADGELPTTTFCEDVMTCMESLDLDVGSCYYRPSNRNWKTVIVFFFMNIFKRLDSIFKVGVASGGAAMAVKAETFNTLGGFDKDLKISEDLEFTRRAVREGYSYRMLPIYVNVSTRRFGEVSVGSILRTVIGGFGTVGGDVFKIPFLQKFRNKFSEWYGETGGDVGD